MWQVPAVKELCEETGIYFHDIHNCMYGGQRRKWTRFVCNFEGMEEFLNKTCESDDICSRTGQEHLSWTPKVNADRRIKDFPTEPEAEYPLGLCQALADGNCKQLVKEIESAKPAKFDFSEVFSGPRAPLTMEMALRQVRDTAVDGTEAA